MTYYIAAFISIYAVCVPLAKKGQQFVEKFLDLNQKPNFAEISSAVEIIAEYNNKRLTSTQAELLLQKWKSFDSEEIDRVLKNTKKNSN